MAKRERARGTARIKDLARVAGVSTATVDRVLNGRPGVAAATVARVREAEAALAGTAGLRPAGAAAAPPALGLALPTGAGPSTEYLAHAMAVAARAAGCRLLVERSPKLDPAALAGALRRLRAAGASAIAFQALEHPHVREAVAALCAAGLPLITLLSDLQGSGAFGFVGADNRAAGRTAGALMGRFTRRAGRVAVLWGGTLYRSHEEREIGFRTVLRERFCHLIAEDLNGGDGEDGNFAAIDKWLAKTPDAVGIYSVGGGNRGVVRALEARGAADRLVVIAHNLTPATQPFLVSGAIDAVIHQDLDLAAARTVGALMARLGGETMLIERLPSGVYLAENAPTLPAIYPTLERTAAPDASHTTPDDTGSDDTGSDQTGPDQTGPEPTGPSHEHPGRQSTGAQHRGKRHADRDGPAVLSR